MNAATAIDYLPGLAIDHASSGRNEASIRLRGFSSKGQVPLYIDGIPVTMPYDGTIDFNRLLSNDISEVQVAKGFVPLARPQRHRADPSTWLEAAGKETPDGYGDRNGICGRVSRLG